MSIISKEENLSFDDVLLYPQHSTIPINEIDLTTHIFNTIMRLPVLSAAMDTITGYEMAKAMYEYGGAGVIHKNMPRKDQEEIMGRLLSDTQLFGFAVSIGDFDAIEYGHSLSHSTFAVVDSAHADTRAMCNFVEELNKSKFDMNRIVIGNISTKEAARRLIKKGAKILKIGQGPGCFAKGTRILMANGYYKNIEDIVDGDKVINGKGKVDTVVGHQFSGKKMVKKYRHSLGVGYSYATEDHLHMLANTVGLLGSSIEKTSCRTIFNRSINKRINWTPLSVVNKKNYYCTLPNNIDFKFNKEFEVDLNDYSVQKYKVHQKILGSYDTGFIFGLFLGDGNASVISNKRKTKSGSSKNTVGRVTFYMTGDDYQAIEKTVNTLTRLGFEPKVKESKVRNMVNIRVHSLPLSRFLNSFGKSVNKKLPENLLIDNQGYLQGLYDGLIASDGHQNKFRDRLTNTSKDVIELFGVLCYKIYGYFPSVCNKKARYHFSSKTGYVKSKYEAYCTSNHSKLKLKILKNNTQISKIIEIDDHDEKMDTYDIQLKNDPSFIANNAVVHNSICSTRVVSGIGVPQLQAIMDIYNMVQSEFPEDNIKLIADGGMRTSGDIVKALAAGADLVMLGGMLAGTDESLGGEIYRGMGSLKSMKLGSATRYGQTVTQKNTPEGVEVKVDKKGPVSEVLFHIEGGLRSGMGYTGSSNLEELKESVFVRITNSGIKESHPHSYKEIKNTVNYKV